MKKFKLPAALLAMAMLAAGPGGTAQAQDYSVTTVSNAIVVTDLAGNSDPLTVAGPGTNLVEFIAPGRTFSVDGGPLLTNSSGALPYSPATVRITVNAGAGNDTVMVQAFTGNPPSLEINGGPGDDTIQFTGDIDFAPDARLEVDLQDDDPMPGLDSILVASGTRLGVLGTGTITLRCSRNVVVDSFTQLETQNGALTVEANQQAVPTAGDFMGIIVRGDVWVNGAGILTVKGRGGTSTNASQHGVFITGATASVFGGHTGVTIIQGTCVSAGDFNYGVGVQGFDGEESASIGTGGSDLSLTGVATGGGASRDNIGVALYFGGDINMWSGGDVFIHGTGGTGTGGNNWGVDLGAFGSGDSEIYNEFGAIQITGVGGAGPASVGVSLRSDAYVFTPFGEVTPGGPITIIADSFNVSADSAVTSSGGEITIRPLTPGTAIELGLPDAPGTLGLEAAEIGRLFASSVVLGGPNNFPIRVTASVGSTNFNTLKLVSGGTISDLNAAGTDLAVSNLVISGSLAPGGGIGIFSAGGNLLLASNSTLRIGIAGNTPGVTHDQLSAAAALTIGTNVNLVVENEGEGYPGPGSAFTIITRTGGGGTFAGLPEGATLTNFLGSGINAFISYAGGDGDDVVITMAAPEIAVQQPAGTDLTDGDNTVSFGNVVIASSRSLVFTVTNSGNGFLNLGGVLPGGMNPGDFAVGAYGATSLAPGESTTFTVTFTPAGLGPRSAILQLYNDDPNENPFDLELTGLSIEPPVTIVCPSNIVTSVAAGTDTVAVNWPDPVAMGTPPPVVTCLPASGSLFPVGVTTVLCVATNSEWTNSCTFTVTVCATNITVVNTNDAGPGSLRQAVADACPGGTVNFAPGLSGMTITLTNGEIAIAKDLTVRGPGADQLAVSGGQLSRIFRIGNATVAIEALALVNGRATNVFQELSGGAIWNEGRLTLAGCALSNNVAAGFGGAVAAAPTSSGLVISNSTFNGNTSMRGGGAVAAGLVYPAATVTLDQLGRSSRYTGVTLNSTTQTWAVVAPGAPVTFQTDYVTEYTDGAGCPGCITQHHLGIDGVFNDCHDASFGSSTGIVSRSFSAPLAPGAYYIAQTATWWYYCGQFGVPEFPNDPAVAVALLIVGDPTNLASTVTVYNSTFSGNLAQEYGGALAIDAYATVRLINSTLAGNSSLVGGGLSVAAPDGQLQMRNVLVAGNFAELGPDVRGTVASEGHNLIGSTNGASGFVASDLLNTNALLGPLQANGGPTLTRALSPGSPAVDTGDNAVATAFDQRGSPRVVNAIIDIGAYEGDFGVAPMITCPADIVVSNAPGQCGLTVNYSLSVTGVPAPVVTASIPSGSFFPVGTNVVFCEASNALGVAACSFTITVVDAEAPVITCPAPIIVAETFAGAGSAAVNFPLPAIADNCGTNLTVTFTPASGSLFSQGTTSVLCSVVDAAGNSNACTFPVTVCPVTLTVVNTDDAGPGSLRDAIEMANNCPGTNRIGFAVTGVIVLTNALPAINDHLIIVGPGPADLALQRSAVPGTPDFRILTFEYIRAELSGVTLSNGRAGLGGGLRNQGQLLISNCVITANTGLSSGCGAGILNRGGLTLVDSVVTGNVGEGEFFYGGGIDHGEEEGGSSSLHVLRCVVATNQAGYRGGGIQAGGPNVIIADSTLSGNFAGEFGGGIFLAYGEMQVVNCALNGNVAGRQGGGMLLDYGALQLLSSAIHGNSTGEDGGGLYAWSDASLAATNCTFSGNTNAGRGGGLFFRGWNVGGGSEGEGEGAGESEGGGGGGSTSTNWLAHCTITGNGAAAGGGLSLWGSNLNVRLAHTIVAANRSQTNAAGQDLFLEGSPLQSLGFNLLGVELPGGGLTNGVNGDQAGTVLAPLDPLLGALQNNGGFTLTHALLPGSPAFNAGDPALTNAPPYDQRGSGFPRVFDGRVDIGAFEVQASAPTITCPADLVVSNAPGQCGLIVNYSLSVTGVPAPMVTATLPSGTFFPVGTNLVVCVASNAAGTATCSFTVTVLDVEPPVLTCPAPVVVVESGVGSGSATVTFPLPVVMDNCGTNLTVTFTPPSGSTLPVGTTNVLCTVVDEAGNSNACVFPVTVLAYTTATAPAGAVLCPGGGTAFTTVPAGTGPFTFAWTRDGSPLLLETNATLTLANVTAADAANYCVIVTGAANAVTNCATLTVLTNPVFTALPPVEVPPGTNVTFCSPAMGSGPITYQWLRAGQPIADATNDCLTLADVTVADEGEYCVVASGLCATATNCVVFAIQRDDVPPRLVSAAILCGEDSAALTRVQVNFSEPMDLGPAINPANYAIPGLNITNVTASSNRTAFVLETDSPFLCGEAYVLQVSLVRDLSGEFLTSASTNLPTQSLPCCNQRYVLELPAGHSLVANQLVWRDNRLADVLPSVPEGSVVRLLKSDVTRTNATTADGYPIDPEFDVFTFSGGAWSGDPVLAPGAGFFIFVPTPTNVTIRGVNPEANLPVPFPASLEIVSRQAPQAGTFEDIFGAPPIEGMAVFRHVTTNGPTPVSPPAFQRHLFRSGMWEGGAPVAEVGEAWFVQAIAPIVITTNPVSQLDQPFGSTVQFTVSAIGAPPLQYQWRRNGVNLPGETNAALTLTNLQLLSSGNYSVAVANAITAVESTPATLSLFLPDLPLTNYYADRVVLLDASGIGDNTNVGADKEPGEPDHAGRPGGKSMWIDWQAPASGIVVFSTVGSTFDTLLAAYTNGVSGLVEVASDEDSGEFLTSRITFYAEAGRVYSIAVDGYGGEEGLIVLSWQLEPTPVALPIIVSAPQSVVVGEGDNVTFKVTAQGRGLLYQWFFNGEPIKPEKEDSGGKSRELKLKKVGPEDVGLYFVRIYTDPKATTSELEYDPLRRIPPGTPFIDSKPISLQINMEGLAKQVRQILAKDKLLDSVTISVPVPANELTVSIEPDPARAVATTAAGVQRSYTGTQVFNTYGAVKQPGEPNHCGIPGGASQWYLYEPPDTGTAFINTDGSSFDTVLAVYTGPGDSFSTLVSVACDNNSGSNGITSRVSFPAQFGTPYLVVVDGVNAATGVVKLNYALLTPITVGNPAFTAAGDLRLQATVTPEVPFALQRSTNFVNWITVLTNYSTNGSFQYIDTSAKGASRATYRLIQKP